MHWQVARLAVMVAAIGVCSFVLADEPAKDSAPDKKKEPIRGPAKGKACEGTFKLGGKTYKFEHVLAYESRIFDETMISVVVSDKAMSADKLKAAIKEGKGKDDSFSLFQPHVKVSFQPNGKIAFCNAWADNRSLSYSGGDNLKGEYEIKDGKIRGNMSLDLPDSDKPDQPRSFDVLFDTTLIVVPLPKAEPKKKAPKKKTDDDDDEGDDADGDKPKPAKVGDTINVHKLPIPKDATDVEFKELVEQITFNCPGDVKSVSAAFSKKLAEQGWKTPDSDLVTPKSAILKRERGEANLTIFVKPADKGSKVTIMSEGLAWDEPESK
jgi:hypothetical protein